MSAIRAILAFALIAVSGCDSIGGLGDEILDEFGTRVVIEETELFGVRKYYYKAAPAGERSFMLDVCGSDCEEYLRESGFSPSGNYYAFLISDSNRFRGGRFTVFRLTDREAVAVADLKGERVTGFTLNDTTAVYNSPTGRRTIRLSR